MCEQRGIESKRKKRRLLAAALSACLLFTSYPDIWMEVSASTGEAREAEDSLYVSGFAGLPEEIERQEVQLGTEREELTLPSALEAFVGEKPAPADQDEGDKDDGAGDSGEGTEDDGSSGSGEGAEDDGAGDSGEGTEEDGSSGSGEGAEDDGAGDSGEGTEEDGSSGSDEGAEEGGSSDSSEGAEEGGAGDSSESAEEGSSSDGGEGAEEDGSSESDESAAETNTVTVSMPEYYAENEITVQTLERTVTIEGVTWRSDPAYDKEKEGTYFFTAVLPDGYALMEGVSLPQITVTVQSVSIDSLVQELIGRIMALPEAAEYMAGEPDVEAEEDYAAWMDGLSAYAEEVLSLWEAYKSLTAEQQAQIPEETLQKLTAWVEIAEQFAESSMVSAAAAVAGSNLTWRRNGDTLTISGTGAMPDFSMRDAPWFTERYDVKSVIIEEGVTSIGNYAFYDYMYLTSVTIPKSVTSIGQSAFDSCKVLENATIPEGVTDLKGHIFYRCDKLRSVTILEGATSIGDGMFYGCLALESVTIPKSVTSIGEAAFRDCVALTNVKIPESVTSIGVRAFNGCSALESVTIPKDVPEIEVGTFGSCRALKSVTFMGNPNIAEKTSNSAAFYRCESLTDITFQGREPKNSYQYLEEANNTYRIHIPCGTKSSYAAAFGWEENSSRIDEASHKPSYSASGAVITERCANGCDHAVTATLSLNNAVSRIYSGSEIKPAVVTVGSGWLGTKKPDNTSITYEKNVNATTESSKAVAKLKISDAVASLNFEITPASISGAAVTLGASLTYNGKEQTQSVSSVKLKAKTLAAGTDYDVSKNTGTNAGTYTLTIAGTGNYSGTLTKEFTIAPAAMTVTGNSYKGTYDGKAHGITVSAPSGAAVKYGKSAGSCTLSASPAYTDAGSYTVYYQVKKSNYVDQSGSATITINPRAISGATVTLSDPLIYTGEMQTQRVSSVIVNGMALEEGKDYTVSDNQKTEAGTYTLTITGKNNYSGTKMVSFTVEYAMLPAGRELTDYADVTPQPIDGWYTPQITITPKDGFGLGETSADIGTRPIIISEEVGPDEGTKIIYVKDSDGSIYRAEFPYKLDKTPPVADLSGMIVTDGTKGLWNWIIGKESMIIKIPASDITDALSGIAEVTYTAASEDGTEQTEIIRGDGGYYEIALHREYTGTIRLTAKDKAGNATQVSLTADAGKVIAEDHAPVVKITLPDTPAPNENGWYSTPFGIAVAVTDEEDGVISGGIARIIWKDGESGAEQTVAGLPGTAPVYHKEFTIQMAEDGTHSFYINAVDNAGNESGWQTVTLRLDTGRPVFSGELSVTDRTQKSAEITFTPSEDGKVYWILSDERPADAQEVKEQGAQNGGGQEVTGGVPASFDVTGLLPGESYTVYAVLEDLAGNLSEVKELCILTLQAAPAITWEQLEKEYGKETVKIPEGFGAAEVYTDPADPAGSMITPVEGGWLPVEPGTDIYIRYPEKTEGGVTAPASEGTKITVPQRPVPPVAKKVVVTETTAAVTDPAAGEEYVLVPDGEEPDWSNPNTTGEFKDLDPNKHYDLYVRKKVTDSSFVSDPVKTDVRTYVRIKDPIVTGDGAGEEENTAPTPNTPGADGSKVPYTGTYGEEYTPVIIIGGQENIPEMTWDETGGEGSWEYMQDIPEDEPEVQITVEFRKRVITGITPEPASLTIYADHAANVGMETLTAYVKDNSSVAAVYDNHTKGTVEAAYDAADSFTAKGAVYQYTVAAGEKSGAITLTVSPVTADAVAPAGLMKKQKDGGYTAAEVGTWLPAQVTVRYTGTGYTERTESRNVTWNTASIGTEFGAQLGEKTINGNVDLPAWASGQNSVGIVVRFADKTPLEDEQIKLTMSDFCYGEQKLPSPQGSITVEDTNSEYTYLYSADGGNTWVTADALPKSDSGYMIPGEYKVKMTYTGTAYIGEKEGAFTVTRRELEILPGTLAVENKNYDGNLDASLKEGGQAEISGAITGDRVTLGGSLRASFAEAGPKKNIPVTVTGFLLEGSDAGYYKLKNETLTLKATINNADGTAPSSGGSGGKDDKGESGNDNEGGNGNVTPGDNGDSGTPTVTPTPVSVTPPTDTQQPGADTDSDRETGTQPLSGQSEQPVQDDDDLPQNVRPTETEEAVEEQRPEEKRAQTIPATIENGRIVISGESVQAGNVKDMTDTSTALSLGDGAVIVTVECRDQVYTAGVADAVAVANAVLTQEQLERVNQGETIEIKIEVADISDSVPELDKEVIKSGIEEYCKEVPGLTLGMHVDLSMFIRVGTGEWNAVTETDEPVEVVIGVPEKLLSDDRAFYIIRAHNGESTFMNDQDDVPDTITISTGMFSSYAIAYVITEGIGAGSGQKCGLCHICPTFLGICCFIWLAVISAAVLLVAFAALRRRQREEPAGEK